MSVQWLVNWWNLIFLLPLGLALLYLGLYMVSGLTFGDADMDHDFDADADADVDSDIDAGHDLDAGHEVDADQDLDGDADAGVHEHDASSESDGDSDSDTDADADHETSTPVHATAMSWMGVGRVPASLVLMIFMMSWGLTGFLVNASLQDRGQAAAIVSISVALLVAVFGTHLLAGFVGRCLPAIETSAHRRHALLGSVGEAIFPIDEKFGMASVRDEGGDLYQVPCRVETGAEPIAKGAHVQLLSYNAKQSLFFVQKCAAEKAAVLN